MSLKEVKRLEIVKKLISKRLKQREGASILQISERQVRRLVKSYKESGESGLISKKRGKASNRRISLDMKTQITTLILDTYYDFGPTLAAEKLEERDNIKVSKETVRQIMIKEGLWKAKSKKRKRVHQLRERRSRSGELIQADGSPHDWFEGRRGKCSLIVFIDDATSEFMKLKFFESETTEAYATSLKEYIEEFGRFRALYTDKHSIFKVNNHKDSLNGVKRTQFSRMLKSLDIELITANTPQAKGRVERANKTLQDRLVKELRLRNISTIEDANKFLDEEFREILNIKFMVEAKDSKDMHREINYNKQEEFQIFSIQSTRKVSKNLELQYKNIIYQIETKKYPNSIKNEEVLICESFTGSIKIFYKNKDMKYKKIKRAGKVFQSESSKTLNSKVDKVIAEQESTN